MARRRRSGLTERLQSTQTAVKIAEAEVAGEKAAWEFLVCEVKAFSGLLVDVKTQHAAAEVKLFKPTLQFQHVAMNPLQGLVTEACEGVYRDVVV
jgi:hypothetical protein